MKILRFRPFVLKKACYSLLIFSVIIIISAGCKKDNQSPSTSLKVRVIDVHGTSISGATVKLYKSITDLQNETNQAGSTLTTDAGGEVTFSDLETIKYYWFAEAGCKNNVNSITTTDALQTNEVRIVTSTIIETGTLEFTNQSVYQYQVYINGSLLLTADAQYSYDYLYVPAGSYSISVNMVGSSTTKTFLPSVTCGNKTIVTFP